MLKIVVAGWQGARKDKHEGIVDDGLAQAYEHLVAVLDRGDQPVTVVSGDSPRGGLDSIVKMLVGNRDGWKFDGRRAHRQEKLPGSGTGNYQQMLMHGGVDLTVLFPGPNDSDSVEAMRWSVRYGVPFLGFPVEAVGR
jgi:hypothetical protein